MNGYYTPVIKPVGKSKREYRVVLTSIESRPHVGTVSTTWFHDEKVVYCRYASKWIAQGFTYKTILT